MFRRLVDWLMPWFVRGGCGDYQACCPDCEQEWGRPQSERPSGRSTT